MTAYFCAGSTGKELVRENHHQRVKLGKNKIDERLVYEYLRDYKSLTVCEFLKKLGDETDKNKLRFRPRFSDLTTKGIVSQSKAFCSVCGRKETKYVLEE